MSWPIQSKLDASQLWRLSEAAARQITPAELAASQKLAREDLLQAIDGGQLVWHARTRCLCGNSEHRTIAGIDRFGLPISSNVCQSCGLVFSSPVFSTESLTQFYKHYYHRITFQSKPSNKHSLFLEGQGRKIFRRLKPWMKERSSLRVLDIGAGSGSVLLEFAAEAEAAGVRISGIGLEYSEQYTALFENRGYDLQLCSGDIHRIEISDGPFDVVILSHVLEHFLNPHEELEILKRSISNDTLIYVEVPGLMSLHTRHEYNCDYLRYATLAHTFNFNLASLVSVLNRSGYALLEGNERVEGIFALGHQEISVNSNFTEVLDYLKFLERNREFFNQDLTARLEMSVQLGRVKNFVDAIFSLWPVRWARSARRALLRRKQVRPTSHANDRA